MGCTGSRPAGAGPSERRSSQHDVVHTSPALGQQATHGKVAGAAAAEPCDVSRPPRSGVEPEQDSAPCLWQTQADSEGDDLDDDLEDRRQANGQAQARTHEAPPLPNSPDRHSSQLQPASIIPASTAARRDSAVPPAAAVTTSAAATGRPVPHVTASHPVSSAPVPHAAGEDANVAVDPWSKLERRYGAERDHDASPKAKGARPKRADLLEDVLVLDEDGEVQQLQSRAVPWRVGSSPQRHAPGPPKRAEWGTGALAQKGDLMAAVAEPSRASDRQQARAHARELDDNHGNGEYAKGGSAHDLQVADIDADDESYDDDGTGLMHVNTNLHNTLSGVGNAGRIIY